MHRSVVFLLAVVAATMSSAVSVIASMSGLSPFLSLGLGVVAVVAVIIVSEVLEIMKEKAEDNDGKAV